MRNVMLTIGGHQYEVQCDPEDQATLLRLAKRVDQKVHQVRADIGIVSETRALLFAALFLAEEIDSAVPPMTPATTAQGGNHKASSHDLAPVAEKVAALEARVDALITRLSDTQSGGEG